MQAILINQWIVRAHQFHAYKVQKSNTSNGYEACIMNNYYGKDMICTLIVVNEVIIIIINFINTIISLSRKQTEQPGNKSFLSNRISRNYKA